MKSPVSLILLLAYSGLLLISCSKSRALPVEPNVQASATEHADDNIPPSDYNYTVGEPAGIDDGVNPEAVANVLKHWDQCHRSRTTNGMDTLYASVCLYYGSDQTRDFVIKSKETFFAKHPQYRQYINNVSINFNVASADISFTKHVSVDGSGTWQTYEAYLHLIGGEDNWCVSWESDATTDENIGRRQKQKPVVTLNVDNTTPLDAIFNDKNVGKEICTTYWDLVGLEGEAEEGPLAGAMISAGTIGARNQICGLIRKGNPLNSAKEAGDHYYCGGTCSGGPYTARVLWIYNKRTQTLSVYPRFDGD